MSPLSKDEAKHLLSSRAEKNIFAVVLKSVIPNLSKSNKFSQIIAVIFSNVSAENLVVHQHYLRLQTFEKKNYFLPKIPQITK